jgi:hypothetical protein
LVERATEVEAAGREFRYARRLVAGEQFEAWLERRNVTVEQWRGYLQRTLARARFGEALPAVLAEQPISESKLERCLWPDAICSGLLEELARTLARQVAVAPGVPQEELDGALDDFGRRVASEEALAREIEAHGLEWLRIGCQMLSFADEDAAREAAFCLRSDGLPLAEVAQQAGVPVEDRDAWLDEIEPALAARLVGARPGDVVGPSVEQGRFVVTLLQSKTGPSPDDPAARLRAARAVTERAMSRLADERVVWLEQL